MKRNNKGFTLAELLIVVAIIGVLVAVAMPTFRAQLNRAKYSADEANARSIYAELTADYLANSGEQIIKVNPTSVSADSKAQDVTLTYGDDTTYTYKFSGIAGVSITRGDTTTYPSVTITYGDDKITFGDAGTTSTTPGSGT